MTIRNLPGALARVTKSDGLIVRREVSPVFSGTLPKVNMIQVAKAVALNALRRACEAALKDDHRFVQRPLVPGQYVSGPWCEDIIVEDGGNLLCVTTMPDGVMVKVGITENEDGSVTLAPGDPKPTSMIYKGFYLSGETISKGIEFVGKPFGPFENFDACVIQMTKSKKDGGGGYDEESAKSVCGRMEANFKAKKAAIDAGVPVPLAIIEKLNADVAAGMRLAKIESLNFTEAEIAANPPLRALLACSGLSTSKAATMNCPDCKVAMNKDGTNLVCPECGKTMPITAPPKKFAKTMKVKPQPKDRSQYVRRAGRIPFYGSKAK